MGRAPGGCRYGIVPLLEGDGGVDDPGLHFPDVEVNCVTVQTASLKGFNLAALAPVQTPLFPASVAEESV
ncbi:hypothetical protein SKAU_G00229530 [Synaphobranchus kaupii]|uniref:Uncharacterized protein n=1 Tax=Synaphobranchus kaupii TaxID=118154 RepID=A0A9Q1ISU6_SYNKA|nr:hypothetical protein SKAU_G00229530 [Synaphobranchus kaupii]